ncbi:DNA primase family protein [Lentibacillus salinarum]|uniref:Phage/plasmid primase, P4 family n=1 Tax=Lentibacillus salinarum TaxID=446820 RepID=A0ABW3ZZZ3_9BACI
MPDMSFIVTTNNNTNSEKVKNEDGYNAVTVGDNTGGNGGNNNGNVTGNSDDDGQSNNRVQLPDDVYIPKYLSRFLNNLNPPEQINKKFLLRVGEDALMSKIQSVEEYNMTVAKSLKKHVPTKIEFDEVAVIMMSIFTLRNIQMTERPDDTLLAIYDHNKDSPKMGVYNPSRAFLYEIMERLAPNFKQREMDEVVYKIERAVPTVEQTKKRHLFAVNNGIYNQETKQLMPFSAEYVYLTKIPVDYKPHPINPVYTAPDGYQWDVESWMTDLFNGDQEVIELIWQVIADCLQPNHSRHKSIWFYSEKGNNGKGTLGQLIKNLLGKGNYASLSVADFNHEFSKDTLLGVAANIADENDVNTYLESSKDFKASITGDDININRKHKSMLRMKFLGTNIQMMNGMPKTKDKTDSFYRRILPVPFLKSFTNNGERKYIKDDYINRRDVLEYVLHKALSLDFEEFILPRASAQLLSDYKENNDPVLDFWNELKNEWAWSLLPTQFVYDVYKQWRIMNNPNGKTLKKREFFDNLVPIIESQGEWVDSRKKSVRSAGRMDKGEPLIKTYGLYKNDGRGNLGPWNYLAYDEQRLSNGIVSSKRKDTYKGLERI